jgi:aminoglycoside phosphotransferase family enzyme/predicted kinase
MDPLERQQQLLRNLSEPGRFPHPASSVEHIDTHISTVLLAGEHAYKFKKPLDLGFLDFSSLDSRKRFCAAELEINRVLAPGIYLDLATVRGSLEEPWIDADGASDDDCSVLEYAVHMRRFDRDRQLDRLLEAGRLPVTAMDELGHIVARFHENTERAGRDTKHGTPQQVLAPMLANFEALAPSAEAVAERRGRLEELESWTRKTAEHFHSFIDKRRREGFVRACHGDMHLGNMVYVDDEQGHECLAIFDGIEFNPSLRWIDVASEIAFLTMDLHARGAPGHAHRVLNLYLEHREDLDALTLLPLYQVYRALVRAKVNAIHAAESGLDAAERRHCDAEVERYLALATRLRHPGRPGLILMHGVSGTGKTFISTEILQRLGAIRLRSDIERKRMIGLAPEDRPSTEQESELYSPEGIGAVYRRLLLQAEILLQQGQMVIVDATFLTRDQRKPFQLLAGRLDARFAIVACTANADILRERLAERSRKGTDASDAGATVMEAQLSQVEPPGADEPALHTGPGNPLDWPELERMMRSKPGAMRTDAG